MISILMLSMDRFELLEQTLPKNLANCGAPFELLICDNGSTDPRVIPFLESMGATHIRNNSKNEGISKAFNQLYLRSHGSVIALMSNDILWPDKWGHKALNCVSDLKALNIKSGLMGIEWCADHVPPLTYKEGHKCHWLNDKLNRIFGPTMLTRSMVEDIGLFYEGFDVYGLDDSELNERVTRSGYNSFYIPGLKSTHIGNDVGIDTEYRRNKDRSMERNLQIFWQRVEHFNNGGSLKAELPPLREPL